MKSENQKSSDTPAKKVWDLPQVLENALNLERISAPHKQKYEAWMALKAASNHQIETLIVETRKKIESLLSNDEGALAELLVTKVLSLVPDEPNLTAFLAERYNQRGLFKQSLQLLSELKDDDAGVVLALKGRAAWSAGDMEVAKTSFYALAADTDKRKITALKAAVEFLREHNDRQGLRMLLESMSDRSKDDAEFCLWMGEWLESEEAFDQASEWLERGMGLAKPRSPLYWQIWRANFALAEPESNELYRKVVSQIHQADAERVIEALSDLVGKFPEFWEARFFRAQTYRREGRLVAAEEELRAVLEYFDYPNAWLELGPVLGQLGRHHEALSASTKADLLFEGRNPFAKANIIGALLELGKQEEAKSEFEKLKEAYPGSRATKKLARLFEPKRSGMHANMRRFGAI